MADHLRYNFEEEWSDDEFLDTKVRKKQFENENLEFDDLVKRMTLDSDSKIQSFEEIGLFDPFNLTSIYQSMTLTQAYNFDTDIYPEPVMSAFKESLHEKIQYPKCIFAPDRALCRKMIKALIKFGNEEESEEFFMRFGLVGGLEEVE